MFCMLGLLLLQVSVHRMGRKPRVLLREIRRHELCLLQYLIPAENVPTVGWGKLAILCMHVEAGLLLLLVRM